MQEPISRRAIFELARAGATLAAGLSLGACRGDGGSDGGDGNGGDGNEGGMGSGNRGRRRN
jgi:hypothetical protein